MHHVSLSTPVIVILVTSLWYLIGALALLTSRPYFMDALGEMRKSAERCDNAEASEEEEREFKSKCWEVYTCLCIYLGPIGWGLTLIFLWTLLWRAIKYRNK